MTNLQTIHAARCSKPRYEARFVNGTSVVLDRQTFRQQPCRNDKEAKALAAECNQKAVH